MTLEQFAAKQDLSIYVNQYLIAAGSGEPKRYTMVPSTDPALWQLDDYVVGTRLGDSVYLYPR